MNKPAARIILIASSSILLIFNIIFSCGNSNNKSWQPADTISVNPIGYNLSCPDRTLILPEILHEISGITVIDSSSVACIQDEKGIVFILDLLKNEITKQLVFHNHGDFEDVTRVDSSFYILRSDGVLFEIINYSTPDFKKKTYSTGIFADENEGLCYDKENNRLLIAPKLNNGKGSDFKKKHPIYGFSLSSGKIIKDPVFKYDLSQIKEFASKNEVFLPGKSKKKAKKNKLEIYFRPSAIGIHPITNKLFVLSGMERLLFVFNMSGTIEYIEKLDPELFNMPEGIAYFKNGDMLISNEGQNKKPTLLRFNYIGK
jgi:hypothetical protein